MDLGRSIYDLGYFEANHGILGKGNWFRYRSNQYVIAVNGGSILVYREGYSGPVAWLTRELGSTNSVGVGYKVHLTSGEEESVYEVNVPLGVEKQRINDTYVKDRLFGPDAYLFGVVAGLLSLR